MTWHSTTNVDIWTRWHDHDGGICCMIAGKDNKWRDQAVVIHQKNHLSRWYLGRIWSAVPPASRTCRNRLNGNVLRTKPEKQITRLGVTWKRPLVILVVVVVVHRIILILIISLLEFNIKHSPRPSFLPCKSIVNELNVLTKLRESL